MGIVETDIAKVRDATDIVKLISSVTQLRKVGRQWSGLCPFHNEKSPSFSVNAEQGVYYCFGCQKRGDAITFVRETQHLDFASAVERLAQQANISLTYTTANEGAARRKRNQLAEAAEAAVEWYHQRLLSSPDAAPARAYLRSRGLDGDQVRRYRLGWSPEGWDVLAQSLGLPAATFAGAGLGYVNDRGRLQDHFRGRVMFPIFEADGTAAGFGGRILPGGRGPKYKNSPDSTIYNKSRLLYGLNWAKDEIVRANQVIICEGYTDVIGFAAAEAGRAVATCGTALTEDHVRLLSRFAKQFVLAFDADAAGQNAAERIYAWESDYGLDVRVAAFPAGVDPAELAQQDPLGLQRAIDEARPFMAFRLDRVFASGNLSSVEGRARLADVAIGVIREHPNAIVRDQYLMEVADRTRSEPQRLRELLERPAPRAQQPASTVPTEAVPDAAPRPYRVRDTIETQMLRVAVHRPAEVPAYIEPAMFLDPRHQQAFAALLDAPTLADAIDSADPDAANALSQLAVLDEPVADTDSIVATLLYQVGERALDRLRRRAHEDPLFGTQVVELKTALGAVPASGFDRHTAERLLPWVTPDGQPMTASGSAERNG